MKLQLAILSLAALCTCTPALAHELHVEAHHDHSKGSLITLVGSAGDDLPGGPAAEGGAIDQKRDRAILQYKIRIETRPEDTDAMARLGLLYLDQARSIEDPRFYSQAESLFTRALGLESNDFASLLGMASLSLSRHDFKAALNWADRGLATYAESAPFLGVLVDGNVELGRYDEATVALDRMLAVKPDLTAYARASYLFELRGEHDRAIEAMEMAANAGRSGSEEAAWCRVHVGDLHWKNGRLDQAEQHYRAADAALPGYPRALAGLARLAAARGELETAEMLYGAVLESFPSAQYRIELGDVLVALGHPDEAAEQYHLVRDAAAEAREHGMNVDLEMSLFELDHGADPAAIAIVAEDAYDRRPSVQAALVLGWSLYKADEIEDALPRMREALRLGTRDPDWLYRAGVVFAQAGQPAEARRCLEDALRLNPQFSPVAAPDARRILSALEES